MVIPLWTLPKLRISLAKKLALICLFALGSFAIVASTVRCVISVIDSLSLTKVLIWSSVEEVVVVDRGFQPQQNEFEGPIRLIAAADPDRLVALN